MSTPLELCKLHIMSSFMGNHRNRNQRNNKKSNTLQSGGKATVAEGSYNRALN